MTDNHKNGGGAGRKRSNEFVQNIAKRFKATYNRAAPIAGDFSPIDEISGPIYRADYDDPLILESFLDTGNLAWDSTSNPNGVVPVIVHSELVHRNGLPLTQEQRDGVQFLWKCWAIKKGGILAHDMGLGKTRTTITLIGTLLQQTNGSLGKSRPGIKKAIIITPKHAVSVWEDEFQKWMPTEVIPCKIEIVRPGQKDGLDVVNKFGDADNLTNVLILSYETFQKYNSQFVEGFANYPINDQCLVICDEAHVLRNEDTGRVKNLRKFVGTNLWLGITGTPYHNNVRELCNLVRFFYRGGRLDKDDYRKVAAETIDKDLRKHRKIVTAQAKKYLEEVRELIRPGVHFRGNNLNLEKHEVILCIPLDGHPHYYSEETRTWTLQHQLYEKLSEFLGQHEDITFFEKLSLLHKAVIHPEYLKKAMAQKPQVFRSLLEFYDSIWNPEDLRDSAAQLMLPLNSAKINVVSRMATYLKEKLPDEKIVIVSNSVVLLKYVKDFLNDALNIKSLVYDGQKSATERERCLRSFETDDSIQILLLSLKAGGTALTLTRANHLVLMDPDYNPANDRQALARIYRPTQDRPVFIYRLLATGTLEEHKYIHQLGKQEMEAYFRSGEDNDVPGGQNLQAFFKESDLLGYDTQSKSVISRLLDQVGINSFNSGEDDRVDRVFAEELQGARKYLNNTQIPDVLPIVREIWEFVSFAFHLPKVPDDVEAAIFN